MEEQFETLINGLLEHEYGVCNAFIDDRLTGLLRTRLLDYYQKGMMYPAGTGRQTSFERNLKVRGDVIYWLDKANSPEEQAFLEHVEALIGYLNSTCYAGINAYEFHFALYDAGSFYVRHRDQFKSDQGRKYSLVTYLNENWEKEKGGALMLYPGDETAELFPEGGRAVFFKSDVVEHEVQPAIVPRLSIAGWLKRI